MLRAVEGNSSAIASHRLRRDIFTGPIFFLQYRLLDSTGTVVTLLAMPPGSGPAVSQIDKRNFSKTEASDKAGYWVHNEAIVLFA